MAAEGIGHLSGHIFTGGQGIGMQQAGLPGILGSRPDS